MRKEAATRFINQVRALLYFDWVFPPGGHIKGSFILQQCWVRFNGGFMSAKEINSFAELASIGGASLTKKYFEPAGHSGIPGERLLRMLNHALTLEAKAYVRTMMRPVGEIKVGFFLDRYFERTIELVGTGMVSWSDLGISERVLKALLESHRKFSQEFQERTLKRCAA